LSCLFLKGSQIHRKWKRQHEPHNVSKRDRGGASPPITLKQHPRWPSASPRLTVAHHIDCRRRSPSGALADSRRQPSHICIDCQPHGSNESHCLRGCRARFVR
jgi:hypothetical protein